MQDFSLWCEDTREAFFFWLREPEFAWLAKWMPSINSQQETYEKYILNIIRQWETLMTGEKEGKEMSLRSVYGRLLSWRSPVDGRALDYKQRASESMDLMGKYS